MKKILLLMSVIAGCSTTPATDASGTTTPHSSNIRFDNKTIVPFGYIDYCKRYPLMPECGGDK